MTSRYARIAHTNGNRGPILSSHQREGHHPRGRGGTSETCRRSCSASTIRQLPPCLRQQGDDLGLEHGIVRLGGVRLRSDDEQGSGLEVRYPRTHDLSQASLHPIAPHGIANGLGYDETHAAGVGIIRICQAVGHEMIRAHADSGSEDSSEVIAAPDPVRCGDHALCRDFGTSLTTTRSQDGAAGTGAHAQTETVLLGTLAVVGLESTLTHFRSPISRSPVNDNAFSQKTAVRVSTAEHSCAVELKENRMKPSTQDTPS